MAARLAALFLVPAALGAALAPGGGGGSLPLPTTVADFVQPGTQPNQLLTEIRPSTNCQSCHGLYDEAQEPFTRWAASMMGQSARDPIFYAAVAIANQDAPGAGEMCLRCHTPGAWLAGRSQPDTGALDPAFGDLDGVNCNLCHRTLDPLYEEGTSPIEDGRVLRALDDTGFLVTSQPHGGQYVVDPVDRRRGPFDLGETFPWHEWLLSPWHREAQLCGTCHDVSNPVYGYDAGTGGFVLNAFDTPHPTAAYGDVFPVERTYGEWLASSFAIAPIDTGGRFGGNQTHVASCQDCHMPKTEGSGCNPALSPAPPMRSDLPRHDFNGVNSWVLRAVRSLYPDFESGLTAASVDEAIARTVAFQQAAADLQAFERAGELVVRVVNRTGHRLPTGYGEGRRMWLEVRFRDAGGALIAERGHYDDATADLTTADTTVFEVEAGLDAAAAAATGLPAGPSFHFVLNNTFYKDNRIPPRGFTNAAFQALHTPPVGESYLDHQYWHDSVFPIPGGTATVEVRLRHQTTTKEYIEFLRDANTTASGPLAGAGQTAYDQWVLHGMSAPVTKATAVLDLGTPACPEPIAIGLGKVNSAGERGELAWTGAPSASGGGFTLEVRNGRPLLQGTLYWDTTTVDVPFQGGVQLIGSLANPVKFSCDANGEASIPIPIDAGMAGTQRFYQAVFRDEGPAGPAGLTNGVFVELCP